MGNDFNQYQIVRMAKENHLGWFMTLLLLVFFITLIGATYAWAYSGGSLWLVLASLGALLATYLYGRHVFR